MENNNLEQNEIQKSIDEVVLETKENLIKVLEDSKLPISILSYIIQEVSTTVINQNIQNNNKIIQSREKIK